VVFPTHLAPELPGRKQPLLLETGFDEGILQLAEGESQLQSRVLYQ
jgi:hypothetical protein